MIDSVKDAITERIKTPIIGTYLLLFAWFNYLQIHKLIVNFNDFEKTKTAYEEISFSIYTPLKFTIVYILLLAVIKIFGQNWDTLVNIISNNILDKLSKFHFTENLKVIDTLTKKELIMSNSIANSKGKNRKLRAELDKVIAALKTTEEEAKRSQGQKNSISSLTIIEKSAIFQKAKEVIRISKELDETLDESSLP